MKQEIRLDVYLHGNDDKLDQVISKLDQLVKGELKMAGELDRLTATVTDSVTVQEGAITLLGQLSEIIRGIANDPAKINALADSLDAEKQKMADAIVANTPPPAP